MLLKMGFRKCVLGVSYFVALITIIFTSQRIQMELIMQRLQILVVVLAALSCASNALAKKDSQAWAMWNSSDETNSMIIDHSAFDSFLKTYVLNNHSSGINRFRYADVTRRDAKALDKYIAKMASIDPRDYRKLEQKAYWLNLYNALTLQGLLKVYPVTAVDRDKISRKRRVSVAGKKLSVADIDQRILRPVWQDYKMVFGLSCATVGCPAIHAQAFTGRNTNKLLKQYAREFINHPRGLTVSRDQLRVSRIFSWYRDDFGGGDRQLIRLFSHYAGDSKALYILGFSGDIEYAYDKRINAPETRWPL
jgi:hypothetical protein